MKDIGEFENTLIMAMSSIGASFEGSPQGSINELSFFNNVAESVVENLTTLDKLGRPETSNLYA